MRRFPSRRLAPACLAVATVFAMAGASAQTAAPATGAPAGGKIKVGFMLPYTGTYAALGNAIENGFRMYVQQQGGKLGGREIEYFKVDDESDPAKAPENATKLVKRDQVDVVVGTVHSGVQMGIVKVAKENNTLLIIPNAGVDEATGPLCGPNIFRTSFSNWQPGYAMGQVLGERGLKKVVTLTWKYAAGEQSVKGFKEAFEAKGGKVVKELSLPFPNVEFQALITEVASLKPDAVFVFFAGGGAVKFVKDWAAAGLKDKIPLYGSGFLTDGTLEAQGNAAQGLETTLHYADGLSNARDKNFRLDYAKTYKLQPDVYAVQGYDAAQLLAAGATAVKGDMTRKADLYKAMGGARIDSPRGTFTLSKAHNPVQDFYLRKVDGRENKVSAVAVKALADPARGCRL
ncbi:MULTISPECIES: ABC transporter substrate-binding protein [Cupriavidus]|uniref:ABC-type branched-chain amino acid transport systems, periplasmic component n=1 Tax=Cupriavidus taiwanensis TaxID=164546 RepID=A0A375D1Y8_9BURK|nr:MULTISPECIES: ABC transporter substrate-binding protein [Cupriavidus]MEC3765426.1 ABC transporter substrate-binding protein [Cupriavidus sp. SS-3]SOY91169.1 putative ABC-type branched-chain amino acid transport systems, periplasmic component [Cupriavidus taiwanensis]SOY91767.1 putative ABC-type branched-chain amino acid transport systems, periplasmic component [Cupriavidus taiwanensis]SPD64309.1 putative ABC-type branched-chain amino acid transport systems, periplasmic component [Cupriavidus